MRRWTNVRHRHRSVQDTAHGRDGWGPATGVLSKELGYLSGVPGRLSDGFVTFLFSVGRARDATRRFIDVLMTLSENSIET
jgi:hypothetical protein